MEIKGFLKLSESYMLRFSEIESIFTDSSSGNTTFTTKNGTKYISRRQQRDLQADIIMLENE